MSIFDGLPEGAEMFTTQTDPDARNKVLQMIESVPKKNRHVFDLFGAVSMTGKKETEETILIFGKINDERHAIAISLEEGAIIAEAVKQAKQHNLAERAKKN